MLTKQLKQLTLLSISTRSSTVGYVYLSQNNCCHEHEILKEMCTRFDTTHDTYDDRPNTSYLISSYKTNRKKYIISVNKTMRVVNLYHLLAPSKMCYLTGRIFEMCFKVETCRTASSLCSVGESLYYVIQIWSDAIVNPKVNL